MRKAFVSLAVVAMMLGIGASPAAAQSTQVAGIGLLVAPGEGGCVDAGHSNADYAIDLNGDLQGCIYGYITLVRYHENSGTYQERAEEVFVGSWGSLAGTFDLIENFSGKFDPETGAQVFGRCKHPITEQSGTGDFMGITGRLDFTDDVEAGNIPYRGHLKLAA